MTSRGVWVAPEDIDLSMLRIAGLPVVNAVPERLGFDELVCSYLPEPDPRCQIEAVRAIGVLVRNLCLGRQPLYGLGAWAGCFDPQLLGLGDAVPEALNDDCVGRALDELFAADQASLLTALSLSAIASYGITLEELHDDSASIYLYGAYGDAHGELRGGGHPQYLQLGVSTFADRESMTRVRDPRGLERLAGSAGFAG